MSYSINRVSSVGAQVTLTDAEATTPLIPFAPAAGALVFVTAVSGAATITWHAAYGDRSAAVPLSSDGAVTTDIEAGKAYPLPDACFAAPFLKAVLDSGTATVIIAKKG